MVGSVWPLAWRWRRLLAARGVARVARAGSSATYFVAYAAGQVLPTSLGGDASRIYETARRNPGAGAAAAGTVLLERALGGAATLVLAAAGFALAVGRYDDRRLPLGRARVRRSRAVRRRVRRSSPAACTRSSSGLRPLLRALRVERPLREVYLALHAFRGDGGCSGGCSR